MPPEEEATARGIQLILHKEAPKRNTLLAEVNNIKEGTWQFKNKVFTLAQCGAIGSTYSSQI
jgi:hypothetical protein